MNELGLEVMVTEIVPGGDDRLLSYCGYLDERGELLTEFTFRKIRQFPPQFGLGCYVVSDWNPEVAETGLRFLRGIGLRGLFHVEFKRDSRDDQLKLIECNHRFTIELVFSPTNLPLLTYNRLLGRPLPSPGPYRTGKRLWNPVEDTKAARSYRRHGELSWSQWLRSLLHLQQLHAFRWDDPRADDGLSPSEADQILGRCGSAADVLPPPQSRSCHGELHRDLTPPGCKTPLARSGYL